MAKKKGMAKKKKGKGGKKKKAGKKKAVIASDKKPKGPTEKELLEKQVGELRQQFQLTHENLSRLREEQKVCKTQFEGETTSKESCVAHLKRALRRESERRMEVQGKLQVEKELGELAERRVLDRTVLVNRNNESSRGVSLQQKVELEGKLSLLEELRLARESQRANLKRVESALTERATALGQKTREDDMNQVDRLLRNREGFVRMCKEVKTEWSEAFKVRMPVHAQKQLKENIRLRGVCRDTTKMLLQAQEQNRVLKQRQKSLNLEEEIQNFAEENVEDRKGRQESRLSHLLQVRRQLTSTEDPKLQRRYKKHPLENDGNADSLFLFRSQTWNPEIQRNGDDEYLYEHTKTTKDDKNRCNDEKYNDLQTLHLNAEHSFEQVSADDCRNINMEKYRQKRMRDDGTKQESSVQEVSNMDEFREISENIANIEKDLVVQKYTEGIESRRIGVHVGHNKPATGATAKHLVDEKMTTIKRCRIDRCRLEDVLREMEVILEDQSLYRRSLESQIETQHMDINGVMMSAILRAGKIFESRCCRTEKNDVDLDFDVLHQLRMLLDLSDIDSEYRL